MDNKDLERQQYWDNLRAELSAKAEAERIKRDADPAYAAQKKIHTEQALKAWASKERNRAAAK